MLIIVKKHFSCTQKRTPGPGENYYFATSLLLFEQSWDTPLLRTVFENLPNVSDIGRARTDPFLIAAPGPDRQRAATITVQHSWDYFD